MMISSFYLDVNILIEFDYDLKCLSENFYKDYPSNLFPEILEKDKRAYCCVVIETKWNYFICIPFRTNMHHKNGYHFKTSERAMKFRSGIDYSKMVLISNPHYFTSTTGIIDKDEFNEFRINKDFIINEALEYLETFEKHIKGEIVLHKKEFERKYKYSSLQYFIDFLC